MSSQYKLKNISPRKLIATKLQKEYYSDLRVRYGAEPRSKSQMRSTYNLEEFFNNNYDETKLLASISNQFSDINDTHDKWETMCKMITSKQNYSTLLVNQRLNPNETNTNFPFIYIKRKDYIKNIIGDWTRKQTERIRERLMNGVPDNESDLHREETSYSHAPKHAAEVERQKKFENPVEFINKYKDLYSNKSIKKIKQSIEQQKQMNETISNMQDQLEISKKFRSTIRQHQVKLVESIRKETQDEEDDDYFQIRKVKRAKQQDNSQINSKQLSYHPRRKESQFDTTMKDDDSSVNLSRRFSKDFTIQRSRANSLDKIDRQLKSHNNLFAQPIQESQEDNYKNDARKLDKNRYQSNNQINSSNHKIEKSEQNSNNQSTANIRSLKTQKFMNNYKNIDLSQVGKKINEETFQDYSQKRLTQYDKSFNIQSNPASSQFTRNYKFAYRKLTDQANITLPSLINSAKKELDISMIEQSDTKRKIMASGSVLDVQRSKSVVRKRKKKSKLNQTEIKDIDYNQIGVKVLKSQRKKKIKNLIKQQKSEFLKIYETWKQEHVLKH
ncbi:UNKNOWN [Stylonychia lemnae]|uniref:Uncharacterized protein n=1 Tax=Stylonychia lemnae TaxID=5949 RepID=A0A078B2D0_STYLE|nr:UNKNOWN [Stylonychia lemnae]|eukprot:CDW87633.1 UNKNOWN [Stylonychia lemnae]